MRKLVVPFLVMALMAVVLGSVVFAQLPVTDKKAPAIKTPPAIKTAPMPTRQQITAPSTIKEPLTIVRFYIYPPAAPEGIGVSTIHIVEPVTLNIYSNNNLVSTLSTNEGHPWHASTSFDIYLDNDTNYTYNAGGSFRWEPTWEANVDLGRIGSASGDFIVPFGQVVTDNTFSADFFDNYNTTCGAIIEVYLEGTVPTTTVKPITKPVVLKGLKTTTTTIISRPAITIPLIKR